VLQGTLLNLEQMRQLLAETEQLLRRNIHQVEETLDGLRGTS
jgi:hypothetical protein